MKLVIDIPETMLDWIKNGYPNEDDMGNLIDIVLDGTPLDDIKAKIKTLGEEMRITQKSIADSRVLIGFNMALALCNKHIGGDTE